VLLLTYLAPLPPPLLLPLLLLLLQDAGTEVVEAKAGGGSATLSMAYAAARMAESTLLGLQGEPNMYECAFVQSDVSGSVCLGGGCCGHYWDESG
jgi:malate/lactate dehydrogenase